ncbi:TIM barrel protein [Rhodoluna limnophila]|uniref:TIM barrel protein n=1 Tax=Rhodoluna limnophila TaxID=232537 RepID=UPI001105901F|nr:TIM barrel protein [Rhodoluna limnophila]
MKYQLGASAEMLFLELPFIERVNRIKDEGFLVEIWNWANKDLDALAKTGATFSSMTGYLTGDLITDDGAAELIRTAKLSLQAAEVIDSPRLNLHGTGLDENGQAIRQGTEVTPGDWAKAVDTLKRIAELGESAGRVFTLENLNLAVDHPGTPFAKAADTMELVKRVNSEHLKMNLDLYHAQIGEGNLVELVREALPYIGEIQVADVPGRCEPGTGEIYYPRIAAELESIGYDGVVALEGWAQADLSHALAEFRRLLTPQ